MRTATLCLLGPLASLMAACGGSGRTAADAGRDGQSRAESRPDADAEARMSPVDAGPDAPKDSARAVDAAACGVPGRAVDAGAWTAGPVDVPITITKNSSGDMRFGVPVTVGDAPAITVQLDTGSSGLRILAGSVPESAFSCITTTPITYSYHSGLMLTGVVAFAPVTVGGVTTPAPIPVMLVNQVGCIPSMPTCSAAGKTPLDYDLFGFPAVFGVGMRVVAGSGSVGSPLAQLPGHPSFVVASPAYGAGNGTLRLAPSAADVAAFKTYQLPAETDGVALPNGTPAFDDRYGLPSCVDDSTSGQSYCLPMEMDTGNPPTYIEWPGDTAGTETVLPSGSKIAVTIGPPDASLAQYAFTVGSTPTPGIDEVVVEPATGAGFTNVGTTVFFRFDVLFDPYAGLVGLAPH